MDSGPPRGAGRTIFIYLLSFIFILFIYTNYFINIILIYIKFI